ncbi:MAG: mandelate racemase/muconate lactonizing enzyme family protein [Chloroflexi bacterium]|nr:mandelate racemase/muconate lactonizing enzyme family protein [Chloroflexota bacterium]
MTAFDSTVTRVTTLRADRLPNECWIEVTAADGRVGLGETYGNAATVEAYVHEVVAPYLLGEDADPVERHWWRMYRNWGPGGIGVESRAISAVDMALSDLLGQRTGLPLHAMLGGAVRPRIRAYNTCGGPEYGGPAMVPGADMRGLPATGSDAPGPNTGAAGWTYEDLQAFHEEPERLAEELLDMGFHAMKIWPLDPIANVTDGRMPSDAQIREGLLPLRRIRQRHGDRIEIALELHGRWDLPAALRIAAAAEEYRPLWFEDPIPMDDLDALGRFVAATRIPTLAGESLGLFQPYGPLLDTGLGIVSADPSYCGGVTGLRRVADLAGLRGRSLNTHDCQGPVNLAISVHVALHADAAALTEMVRAFYFGWYEEFVTGQPLFEDGWLRPSDAPGHGVRLRPEIRPALRTRVAS